MQLVTKQQMGISAIPITLIAGTITPSHWIPSIRSHACRNKCADDASFFTTVTRSKAADICSRLAKLAMIIVLTTETVIDENAIRAMDDAAQNVYQFPVINF